MIMRQATALWSLVTCAVPPTAGAVELSDPKQTLEALGLDNRAMLVMRWAAA